MSIRSLLVMILLLAGCASGPQGVGQPTAEAAKEVTQLGIVESVTPIELDASTNAGANLGGIFGQVGGANTGGGRGTVVGQVFGAVLGSTVGHQAGIATKPGLEIWVKLDETGKSAYVTQAGKPDAFKVGDRVRVMRKGNLSRIELAETPPASATPPAAEPAKDKPKP